MREGVDGGEKKERCWTWTSPDKQMAVEVKEEYSLTETASAMVYCTHWKKAVSAKVQRTIITVLFFSS